MILDFQILEIIELLVAVTPANPNVVYILYSAGGGGFGGLYKSTDGGYNFTLQSNSPNILSWEVDGSGEDGQGNYDLALAISLLMKI